MAARKKSNSLLLLALLALLVVGGVFLFLSKSSVTKKTETAKQTAKPVATRGAVSSVSASSGPVGRNGLRAYAGPGVGEVTLEWQRFAPDGENYSIHYGTGSKNYAFAKPYIGYISTYTVGRLTPGTRYYFAVEGIRVGNVSAGSDGEVTMVAPASSTTVIGTAGPVGRNLLVAKPGPKKGQVTLSWTRYYPDTEKYGVVYGLLPGKYVYGVLNAVATVAQVSNYSYTVGSLSSGKRYYFALEPQRSGTGIYITSEVSVVAP